MSPRGPVASQSQHLRSQGREHALVRRHALGVEHIEIVDKRLVRMAIVRGGLGMSRADAEQESPREVGDDAPPHCGDVARIIGPDVDDAGGDDEMIGGRKQLRHDGQLAAR